MSFWLKLGLAITDIECFKAGCREHGFEYQPIDDPNFMMQGKKVVGTINQNQGFLVQDSGAFRLVVDNDPNYSQVTRKVGKNGGELTRSYAENVVEKNVMLSGGYVESREEQKDGSLILTVVAP